MLAWVNHDRALGFLDLLGVHGKRLRPRGSRVAALALERQHILAEMVGELDHSQRLSRRHHAADFRETGGLILESASGMRSIQ